MHIDITFKNMDSSDALKDYVTKRLSKLDKYIDRPTEVHVVLSVEKIRHKADIMLNANGFMINAVEITEDMYSAIDMVLDKLERQVKKYKGKQQDKKGPRTFQAESVPVEGSQEQPRVIHEHDYFVKPMSVDEAALQLGVTNKSFIIFQNTDTNQINFIYKRDDGDFGLIEPVI
ncbi:MAG: ribosome-associated translation inhibitor RaiA [Deltaproteobacteria bacterium]|nr:ribosome-associated translation inhibitor RaiA [Deltaproteobacteria bacterium]